MTKCCWRAQGCARSICCALALLSLGLGCGTMRCHHPAAHEPKKTHSGRSQCGTAPSSSALSPSIFCIFHTQKSVYIGQQVLKLFTPCSVLAVCFLDVCRQQLLQLVLDTPPSASPPAHGHRSPGSQPDPNEVPGIDSFLRKDKVCTSTRAGGLPWAAQEGVKAEEHQDLDSTSAEAGGADNKVGSQEIAGCTGSHEKPSTSVLKGVKKGEEFSFWLCAALSPTCGWLEALEDPQYLSLTPFPHLVLVCVAHPAPSPVTGPCPCTSLLLWGSSAPGMFFTMSLSCCHGIKWDSALADSFALSNNTAKQ